MIYLREAAASLLLRRESTWVGAPGGAATEREILLATSGKVRRDGYLEVLRIDADSVDLKGLDGAPLLNSHRTGSIDDVIGVISSAEIRGGMLYAKVKFSNRPEVQGIVADVNDGILRGVSVGYSVEKWEIARDPQTGEEIRTATKWTPREGSIVAVPADPSCGFRSADPPAAGPGEVEVRAIATAFGLSEAFVTETRSAGLSLDQTRAAAMARAGRAPVVHNPPATVGVDHSASFTRRLGEAIACRANPSLRPSEGAREFMAHTSFADDAAAILRNRGVSTLGLTRAAVLTRAMATGDFSYVLGEALHQTLRASYTEARSPLWQLMAESSATDFRDKNSISLDMKGDFARVGEGGEIQSQMTIREGKEKYRVATYANAVALTRELIVNDNLGALSGIGAALGLDAARWQDDWLLDQLLGTTGVGPTMSDGLPVFDTTRGNLQAGGMPLVVALETAKLSFYRMRSPTGKLTPMPAKYWIIPPEMETIARKLLMQIQPTKVEDVNTLAGSLTLIVEPRLTVPDEFFLAAETAKSSGFEYAYLSGAAGPQIESENAFDSFAVKYRCWFDVGGGWMDWRGWYKAKATP
jgi:hypothetical protein